LPCARVVADELLHVSAGGQLIQDTSPEIPRRFSWTLVSPSLTPFASPAQSLMSGVEFFEKVMGCGLPRQRLPLQTRNSRTLSHSLLLSSLPPSLPPSLLPWPIGNSYTYGITFFMGVRALLYPPFLLKTKIQVARGATEQSAIQVARATLRKEGIRGLYKVKCRRKAAATRPASLLAARGPFRCTRRVVSCRVVQGGEVVGNGVGFRPALCK